MFELIIVLAIVALIAVIVVGRRLPVSAGTTARATAVEIAAALRQARAEAIAEDRPVGLVVNVNSRLYRVGTAPARAIPQIVQIKMLTTQGEVFSASEARILFNPDGSSGGGEIDITGGDRSLAVLVDWLTGRVTIGPHT